MTRAGPDHGLRRLAHAGLRRASLRCTAIETGGTSSGVPDTFWASRTRPGACGWLEHKFTAGLRLTNLTPLQVGWLADHASMGVLTAVLVWQQVPGAPERLLLIRGCAAAQAASARLADLPPSALMGTWPHPPDGCDWPAVAAALAGG